jgi:hypothetical protein
LCPVSCSCDFARLALLDPTRTRSSIHGHSNKDDTRIIGPVPVYSSASFRSLLKRLPSPERPSQHTHGQKAFASLGCAVDHRSTTTTSFSDRHFELILGDGDSDDKRRRRRNLESTQFYPRPRRRDEPHRRRVQVPFGLISPFEHDLLKLHRLRLELTTF